MHNQTWSLARRVSSKDGCVRMVNVCLALVLLGSSATFAAAAPPRPPKTAVGAAGIRGVDDILTRIDARLERQRRGTLRDDLRRGVSADPTNIIIPLIWNSWAEEGPAAPTFTRVEYLKPESTYWVVLDLSALSYWLTTKPGTYSRPADDSLVSLVQSWLNVPQREIVLDAIVVPDIDHLSLVSDSHAPLRIDLEKVRRLQREPGLLNDVRNPLEDLRRNGAASEAVFARLQFEVRTRDRQGRTSVLVLLWDRGRPVNQLLLPLCIATDLPTARSQCGDMTQTGNTLQGLDSLRTTTEQSVPPDAAFHYVEVGQKVRGVFKRNDCSTCRYLTFDVPAFSLASLQQTVAAAALPAFAAAASDESRLRAGAQIYNALVPPRGLANSGDDVQAAFGEFMKDVRARGDRQPPSLFIRMIGTYGIDLPVLPFGLMAPGGIEGGTTGLVGAWARVELPLPRQTYDWANRCVENWVVAADPAVRTPERWVNVAARLPSDDVFSDIPRFTDWLNSSARSPETGVFVLGHQDGGRMYFSNAPADQVSGYAIRRRFERPSFAVLNGCATAGPAPGTPELIRGFNYAGMSTVIATWTPVADSMAADFMDCFAAAVLGASSDEQRTLAALHTSSVACLVPKWGNRAYTYTLLGNSAVRVCAPRSSR